MKNCYNLYLRPKCVFLGDQHSLALMVPKQYSSIGNQKLKKSLIFDHVFFKFFVQNNIL